jgi:hypothetical protein
MGKKIKGPSSKGLGPSKQFQYLNIPDGEIEVYYDLQLKEFKYIEDASKYVAVFAITATDVEKYKVGSEVSVLLDPYAEFAETYFWRDLFAMVITSGGKEITDKRIEKLREKCAELVADLQKKRIDDDAYVAAITELLQSKVGGESRCTVKRFERNGKQKTMQVWEPLSE